MLSSFDSFGIAHRGHAEPKGRFARRATRAADPFEAVRSVTGLSVMLERDRVVSCAMAVGGMVLSRE